MGTVSGILKLYGRINTCAEDVKRAHDPSLTGVTA